MKQITFKILVISAIAGLAYIASSCTRNLLDQEPTVELASAAFWNNETDASSALNGAYSAVRAVFDRDYYFDGQGEYYRTRTTNIDGDITKNLGAPYGGGNFNPSGYGGSFDTYYRYLYGAVNRTNYVIENVKKMLLTAKPSSVANLEAIQGEARLLRGMVYFRLISMWGDVPYFSKIISSDAEVSTLSRMPIAQVKDSIMADFTYAFDKLPTKTTVAGRAAKPAALAFRGKLQLYWACWNKYGWPELDTFKPDAAAATAAYTAAASDFNSVIKDFGLTLFRNGEPGEIGSMGDGTVLPNYFYLFMPAANNDPELIMAFTHGGTGSGQGEELMRDFGSRSQESSVNAAAPRYELADRYQSTITGDFCPKLVPIKPSVTGARTLLNSAINPASYANRDYRMKATILWDYEMYLGLTNLQSTGMMPFIYQSPNAKVTINGVTYTSVNYQSNNSGYVFRKFVRNYAGQGRSDGDYSWPVMRLADVYLMYAEASNEVNGPQPDAIALVNKIRHRGNLPPLAAAKTSDYASFFSAIEQERIVELVGEGQRSFDLRRWRAIERVWCPPYGTGVWRIDTWGVNQQQYFLNQSELTYQQCYIFRIPQGERDRNPNLTQNKPWM